MENYNTIIWDMDGTLLDTLDDLTDSVNASLIMFNLPVRTISEVRGFVGNGVMRLLELSVPSGKQHPQFDDIFSYFKDYYEKNSRNKTKPYSGLEKLLSELKEQGYRMAIVSNKIEAAVKELTELYFKDTINVAIGDTEENRRKPFPDMVLKAMRLLNAEKESTVYIGDTEVDIATAENTGIDYICVSWGFREKQELMNAGAKNIIDTPEELKGVLAKHFY